MPPVSSSPALQPVSSSRYTFELPPDTASLLPVASCVVVKSASDASTPLLDSNGKPIIRPYTPISPSDLPGELTFIIKRYDQGNMSKYIHSLSIGDKLAIKGPIPKFEFKSSSASSASSSSLVLTSGWQSTSSTRSA